MVRECNSSIPQPFETQLLKHYTVFVFVPHVCLLNPTFAESWLYSSSYAETNALAVRVLQASCQDSQSPLFMVHLISLKLNPIGFGGVFKCGWNFQVGTQRIADSF